jgi:hypothetical protein
MKTRTATLTTLVLLARTSGVTSERKDVMEKFAILLTSTFVIAACGALRAAEETIADKTEGKLEVFMGESRFSLQELFKGRGGRNIVTAPDGTVLAFHEKIVRRSTDGGKTWNEAVEIGPDAGGNAIVDEKTGGIMLVNPKGMYSAVQVAVFNLNWLLQGEKTGNGAVPRWVLP